MWVFYPVFAGLTAFTILQTPKEWWSSKRMRIVQTIIHVVGFLSLLLLITVFYKMDDNARFAVTVVATFYFVLLMTALEVSIVRLIAFYTVRHISHKGAANFFGRKRLFFILIIVLSLAQTGAGWYNVESLVITPYSMNVDKSAEVSDFRVALIADTHIGAGASKQQLDNIVSKVNSTNSDVLILAGDVVDSSTSLSDIEYLVNCLKQVNCPSGIYYAEGNHDYQCHYDIVPYLKEAGVICLKDEAYLTDKGVAILGRALNSTVSLSTVKSESSISNDVPCIAIQHGPTGLKSLSNDCDLVVCGHTHGYGKPLDAFIYPVQFDEPCGMKYIGNMAAVTTAGASAWGVRYKWPGRSDVVQIDMHFNGEAAK